MKVCIVAVCYNAEGDALKLLGSIEKSVSLLPQEKHIDLTVMLADNSTAECTSLKSFDCELFTFNYYKFDNVGYFPAFFKCLSYSAADLNEYDYIIVCNVDLTVGKGFFSELAGLKVDKDCGVIAPAILSNDTGEDINPKITNRVSRKKIFALRFLFSYPTAFKFYRALSLRRAKRKVKSIKKISPIIYAPHGSFIIFTKNYLLSGATLNYPRFLFGEEVFVAEESIKHNLTVVHKKELVIHDDEHGSTSKINSSFLSKEHVKSYSYLLENYFRG